MVLKAVTRVTSSPAAGQAAQHERGAPIGSRVVELNFGKRRSSADMATALDARGSGAGQK
jgi:hypothetical protein